MCKTHINFLKIQQKNFWTENILSQNIFYQQMLDNKFCITKRTLDPFVFRSQIIFGGSNSFLDRKLFGIKFFGTEFFEPRYFGHLSFGTKIVFGIKRSNFFLDFLNLNIYNVGSKNSVNFRQKPINPDSISLYSLTVSAWTEPQLSPACYIQSQIMTEKFIY